MTENNEKNRFGSNLTCQFILLCLASFFQYLLGQIFGTVGLQIGLTLTAIISYSFYIGLLYGIFRIFGVRASTLEKYYQNVPFGWKANQNKNEASITNSTNIPAKETNIISQIKWDKLLTVEYLRYAGVLLIVSAIFSFLFKIEWPLLHKIIASFALGAITITASLLTLKRSYQVLANILFILSYGFVQFGASLLYKLDSSFFYHNTNHLLILKIAISIIYSFGLLKFLPNFTTILFFLISYLGIPSLMSVGAKFDLQTLNIYLIALSSLCFIFAINKKLPFILMLNTLFTVIASRTPHLSNLFSSNSIFNTQDNIYLLELLVFFLILDLLAGAIIVAKKQVENITQNTDYDGSITEYLFSQIIYSVFILNYSSHIPELSKYPGAILVILTTFSFITFFILRAKSVTNGYTEVVTNYSLLISSLGMFLQTEGTWSAIVFLITSCISIYIAIVFGSKRTKIYSFFILTISIIKLYTECYELFESISGTSAILTIGIILIGLSFKLEKIKELVTK